MPLTSATRKGSVSTPTTSSYRSPIRESRPSRSARYSCGAEGSDVSLSIPSRPGTPGEIEGEMGDSHMGLQARLMSQALRNSRRSPASHDHRLFINQIRHKIGIMFGNRRPRRGERAQVLASLRLDIRRIAAIKDGQEVIGSRTRVKIVKNKLAPPSGKWSLTSYSAKAYPRGRCHRPRRRDGIVEKRDLVLVRRRTHRPGPGERQRVPQDAPRDDERGRREDHDTGGTEEGRDGDIAQIRSRFSSILR